LFAWRDTLIIVKPVTFLGWHRLSSPLRWRWKSRSRGRPPLPEDIQKLIRRMARENPTWGEERIAAELLLKLHIRISPRTVLGPGIPDLGSGHQRAKPCGDYVPIDRQVVAKAILGGLHH